MLFRSRMVDESNEIWFTQVFQPKYKWVREGQYVRVKGASVVGQEKESKVLTLRWASNILSIPPGSKITHLMSINEKKAMIEAERLLLATGKGGIVAH